jgi:hypothetical protein
MFAPSPTRPCPFTYDCAQRVGTRNRRHAKNPRPVLCARTWTPCLESMPGPMHPRLEFALIPTSPRPLARIRAQHGRAFISGRTRATSARLQSFPVGAPCSRVRPQQYINLFAPLHKSLCS